MIAALDASSFALGIMAGGVAVGVLTGIAGAGGSIPSRTDGWGGYSVAAILGAPLLGTIGGIVVWLFE